MEGEGVVDTAQLKQAVQPAEVRAALSRYAEDLARAAEPHHGGDLIDVRTARHGGHDIVVRTRYEITVDGRPFDVQMSVNNLGRVHYHGLPTRDFASAVDLVKKAIDVFGEEFAADDAASPAGQHGGRHDDSSGEH